MVLIELKHSTQTEIGNGKGVEIGKVPDTIYCAAFIQCTRSVGCVVSRDV